VETMHRCQKCGEELKPLHSEARKLVETILPKFETGRCENCKTYWIIRQIAYGDNPCSTCWNIMLGV